MFHGVMVALEFLVLSVIVRIGVEQLPLPPSPALSFLPRFCAGLFFSQAVSIRHSFFISRSLLYPVPQPVPKKGGRRKGNYAVRRNQAPLRKGVHRFRRTCSLRTSPKSLEGQRAALCYHSNLTASSAMCWYSVCASKHGHAFAAYSLWPEMRLIAYLRHRCFSSTSSDSR